MDTDSFQAAITSQSAQLHMTRARVPEVWVRMGGQEYHGLRRVPSIAGDCQCHKKLVTAFTEPFCWEGNGRSLSVHLVWSRVLKAGPWQAGCSAGPVIPVEEAIGGVWSASLCVKGTCGWEEMIPLTP